MEEKKPLSREDLGKVGIYPCEDFCKDNCPAPKVEDCIRACDASGGPAHCSPNCCGV